MAISAIEIHYDSLFNSFLIRFVESSRTLIASSSCCDKLYNDDFEVTNKGFGVRGVIPVVVTHFEEVNHIGDEKPNEFGFVTDHSYKYKIYGIENGPDGFRERTWQTDDVGNLKNLV